jgi:hypothetical protein
MDRPFQIKNQQGIAFFTMLLAAIFIVGAIAAVFVNSGSLSSSSTGQDIQVSAAGIINQGSSLVEAFQNMEAKNVSASAITYDSTTATGLFTPGTGSTSYQRSNPSVFAASVPDMRKAWVYKSNNMKIQGIGIDANGDYAFVLRGLTLKVCQYIDNYLFKSTTIPAAGVAAAVFVADSADDSTTLITDATAVDLSATVALNRKSSACVVTTDGEYVYYTVAEPG